VSSYKIVSRFYTTPLHHLSEQNMFLPYEISKCEYLLKCPYLPCLYEKACVNKVAKKGIKIVRGHAVKLLRSIPVTEYMEKEYESIGDNTGLEELIVKAQ
jgi:hypothetical protein